MNKDEFDRLASVVMIALSIYTVYLLMKGKKHGGCGCKSGDKPLPTPSCKGASGSTPPMSQKQSF